MVAPRRSARLSLKWLQELPAPAMLAVLYAGLIVIGTGLLKLPFANTGDVGWLDAMFTSTSAVTVTGLIVVDTGGAFTFFGEAVIAVLIQLGGLGLMTFAVLLLTALDVPLRMPQVLILREDLNQRNLARLPDLVMVIVKVALLFELAGVVLLSAVFIPDFGLVEGLWQAIFHTISAFNNAGFSLFANSLSDYAAHPVVNMIVPALFIVGGLGFVVLSEIAERKPWRRFSLHSKLMLVGTAVVTLLAWPVVALLEWNNPGTLGALDGTGARLQAAWFQAVTPRTAGFNTVDTSQIEDATAVFTMGLMFVGGGSTSTAGGIKLTTFIVLILATVAFFRRRESLHAFGRSLEVEQVMKVLALTMVSLLLIFAGVFLLAISWEGDFLVLLFEVVSAFGTVGLSMGATGELGPGGQVALMLIMFLGRVGPLTLGFFLATRSASRIRYPAGEVYLG